MPCHLLTKCLLYSPSRPRLYDGKTTPNLLLSPNVKVLKFISGPSLWNILCRFRWCITVDGRHRRCLVIPIPKALNARRRFTFNVILMPPAPHRARFRYHEQASIALLPAPSAFHIPYFVITPRTLRNVMVPASSPASKIFCRFYFKLSITRLTGQAFKRIFRLHWRVPVARNDDGRRLSPCR